MYGKKTVFLALIILCSVLSAYIWMRFTDSARVVKIGVFQPLSGDNGSGGRQEALGIEYANKLTPTVNIGGVSYNVELVYADNKSSVEEAPIAAKTLVDAGCSIVLGSYGSSVCIAAHNVLDAARMPTIGISCTNPAVTVGNDFYFRICFLDPYQGAVLANFAEYKFNAKKAYVLAKKGDTYSEGLCEYFLEDFGVDSCVYEAYPEGTTDFSSYVANAKASGAQVLFAPISIEAGTMLIDQVVNQALGIPLLAGDTWDSNVILNAAKGKDVQIFVTTHYQESGNTRFDNGFKSWLNSDAKKLAYNGGDDVVAGGSGMGYDAYYVALEALKAARSTNREKILSVLGNVRYEGITGSIAFDKIGDAVRSLAFIKSANTQLGSWEFVAQRGVK